MEPLEEPAPQARMGKQRSAEGARARGHGVSGTKVPKLLPGDLDLTSGERRRVLRSLWSGLGRALLQASPRVRSGAYCVLSPAPSPPIAEEYHPTPAPTTRL